METFTNGLDSLVETQGGILDTEKTIFTKGINDIQGKLNIKAGSKLMDDLITVLNIKIEKQHSVLVCPYDNLYFCETEPNKVKNVEDEIRYAKEEIKTRTEIIDNYEYQIQQLENDKKHKLSKNQRTLINVIGTDDYVFSLNYSEKKGLYIDIEYISFDIEDITNEEKLNGVLNSLQNEELWIFDNYGIKVPVNGEVINLPLDFLDTQNEQFIYKAIERVKKDIDYFTSVDYMVNILKNSDIDLSGFMVK